MCFNLAANYYSRCEVCRLASAWNKTMTMNRFNIHVWCIFDIIQLHLIRKSVHKVQIFSQTRLGVNQHVLSRNERAVQWWYIFLHHRASVDCLQTSERKVSCPHAEVNHRDVLTSWTFNSSVTILTKIYNFRFFVT